MQNAYEEKERLVLQKIYDLGGPSHMEWVELTTLEQDLGMTFDEVNPILIDFENRDLIEALEHVVRLFPASVREIEKVESKEQPSPHIVIYNPTNSPMSFGPNSSQTVTYNHQNVQDILPQLSGLIQDIYKLQFETRADVIAELQKVETLAKGEMNPGKWQLIQSRLATTKTALDIAKIGIDSLPYWPAVWNFFFK